ncbi:MAG: LPS export ABC transporter permease LptG [Thiomonas sp.]|uniref:LPS export ABC transporter permease LptG n=1 Tax=Thiomonas sp. TaxID=2047785 RepID=UPI002A366C73|nr:LPS export ABC transporter permease LptG [Thiomonas sp.]MDY0329435.1 LPS export ABC transporter permease LptG [Thiomonas sp.]
MRTVRRFLLLHVLSAVGLVTLAFLALLFFIDMLNDLSNLGKPGFSLSGTLLHVALSMPSRAYEVLPIAILVGGVFALASLSASSEFTILRVSGLSPRTALGLLLQLAAVLVITLFLLGEWLAPAAAQLSTRLQTAAGSGLGTQLSSGVWLRNDSDRNGNQTVNIKAINTQGDLTEVHIYVLNAQAQITAELHAASGRYEGDGAWLLHDVTRTELPLQIGAALQVSQLPSYRWQTSLSPSVLGVLLLPPDKMSALDLWRYIQHLRANHQAAERYEIQLWKKLFYPFSAVVMLLLALPFAYLHTRSKGISGKVLAGIVLGIAFILLNTLFSSLGLLGTWPPAITAALPMLLFGGLGLIVFAWQVRFR